MSSDGNKKQFWKRNAEKLPGSIQHVYGAQHPPFDPRLHSNLMKVGSRPPLATPGKPKKATTFQEFESITSDAWDVKDDDDELLAMAAQNLNIEVVMETANKVIENHSKQQERQRQDDTAELDQREEEEDDEEAEEEEDEGPEVCRLDLGDAISPDASFGSQSSPDTEGRLVKSHSEAPIGSPRDAASEHAALHRQRSLPHRPPIIPLVARMADQNTSGTLAMTEREASRLDKFKQLLAGPNTDLDELRKLSWSGIPRQVRPITWKLLSGYLPANAERRESVLQRKRQEYFGFIEQYYDSRNDEHHQDTYRQIHIDIPRTNPLIPLFQQASVQEIFERILFIWAIRHPASGYVQGINDLVTPFFVVFLFEYIEEEVENFDVSSLQEEALRNIEADSFWCMSKLLDGIQAEPEGFSHFHLYVCAAFLVKWRKEILEERDFQVMWTQQTFPKLDTSSSELNSTCSLAEFFGRSTKSVEKKL
uniref:TBC1 domain family, member 22a n=1 Tax=Oryzias sinensis TaxID=183150 RepID=A0A8C7XP27_9TELE